MLKIEKTVFISYRRTNIGFALAVYQHLKQHGYDTFFDYTGINSGDFEQIIMENIQSRAHFLILLTSSALERCNEPGDWLRREIEMAIDTKRNIVPLTFEGFDWGLAREKYLTGKLAVLSNYNALRIPMDYFDEGMEKLRSRYLNIPLDMVLHPAGKQAEQAAEKQQKQADSEPIVQQKTLTAEKWFEKGYQHSERGEHTEAIQAYTEAIRLKPDFFKAYNNRGVAKNDTGDYIGAIADYNEAIRLKPDSFEAYNNRGVAKNDTGDHTGAIADYNEATCLKPSYADAYNNRGTAKGETDDHAGAIVDFNEAIRLKPSYADAYCNRGNTKYRLRDYAGAIADSETALRIEPDCANAKNILELARRMLKQSK